MSEEKVNSITMPPPQKQETNWSDVLTKGEEIAKRIEEANKKSEELYNKNAELAARKLLGGGTTSTPLEIEKPAETPKEYMKRVMKGEK